ncbi:MAG: DUF3179 domain-containing protein [Phycisphaera sp.]|nr:DUF3179 domain-containing protein [Phycisphaera sp.]
MSEGGRDSSRKGVGPLIAVILLGFLGGGVVLAWGIAGLFSGVDPIGDGRDPASYGVDLSNAIVEPGAIIATGSPRDFLPVLDDPGTTRGDQVASQNAENARKWQKEVVSDDRVVGVTIGGESRAYPLFIADAHEIVTDELGGVPIVMARSPLVDEVMVFDRRLPDGTVVDLGVSGLLDDLALLMHDRRESTSVWSAHDGRAVAGPAVGGKLSPIPGVTVARWRDWLDLHPDTSVALRDPGSMRRYRRIDYRRYHDGDKWLLEPRRLPSESTDDLPSPRDRVLSVLDDDGRLLGVVSLDDLRASDSRDGVRVVFGERTVVVAVDDDPISLRILDADGLVTRFGMWASLWARDPEAAERGLERGRAAIR